MRNIALVLILGLLNIGALANSATHQFNYNGQQFESFDLSLIDTVTRYRSEMRDTTCTRQVPYQTEECRNETRYRQECRQQPGRNVCRTEYEQRCRTVTRYRQQCRQEPGRQVCRQTQPQRICRNGQCRTIPGRRICENKPGRRVCNRVPYQERECTREPRRVCDWEPGRRVCSDVPYQERVCRNVTRYRDETYACRRNVQIPYDVEVQFEASVDSSFQHLQDILPNVDFTFELDNKGDVQVRAYDNSEISHYVTMNKNIDIDQATDLTQTRATFDFGFINKEEALSPLREQIRSVGLLERAVFFTMGKVINPDWLSVDITISDNGNNVFNETLSGHDFTYRANGDSSRLQLLFSNYGLSLAKGRRYDIKIEVSIKPGGEVINSDRAGLTRDQSFSSIRVN